MIQKKVALVTGVSSGIGRATVTLLLDRGFRTFGTLRDYEQEIDPFTKIRIGFSHPLSRSLEGFLNIENLTNDQVGEWITIAPSRGRTVLVGVRFGL